VLPYFGEVNTVGCCFQEHIHDLAE
jgi:hypothetical protein